jgi:hypothetical protein
MKRVTITVDKQKYENLDNWERKTGSTAKEDIVKAFRLYIDIANEPKPPKLHIVKKSNKEQKAKRIPNNITKISASTKPPETIRINLDIEDTLYRELIRESDQKNIRVRQLAEEWANTHMDICNPEINETTKDILAYIGIPLIEVVK